MELSSKIFRALDLGVEGRGKNLCQTDLGTIDKDVVTQKALHQSCVLHCQCIKCCQKHLDVTQ